MARNFAQRLDRLERLASALLASDTSPVYCREGQEGVDPERLGRLFPKCWFNEATTEAGRDALGYTTRKRMKLAMWA
jgi:hypothetical protein